MPFKKLQIPNTTGQYLGARLDRPDAGEIRAYALFAHCFTCNKNYKAIRNISRALNEAGIAVLRFDFTGLGESEGDFADTNFSSNVTDLVAVADFLAAEYEAPRLLIGHSLGGAAVLQAASHMSAVQGLVTINAPAEPTHIIRHLGDTPETIRASGEAEVVLAGRPFKIKKQFLDDLEQTHMQDVIGELRKPLLIVHAVLDDIVGLENAGHIFEAALHPKSFISLHQADHLLSDEADSCYVGALIAAWFERYLEG